MSATPTPASPGIYRLLGGPGSPYSLKMRAILRYRHIPHRWIVPQSYIGRGGELEQAGKRIIPVLQYPDGSYWADSTPLALALEHRHPGARSIVPEDPALAFLSHLIEDMADELLVSAMFDLRWGSAEDQRFCAWRQMSGWLSPIPSAELEALVGRFTERQTTQRARMLAGDNHALLMDAYGQILDALEGMLDRQLFVFGSRPALADFGLYGQLSQCAIDPSASAILRTRAARVYQWVQSLDDASGVDGHWYTRDTLGETVQRLLDVVGRYHLPMLAGHHAAIEAGEQECATTMAGGQWRGRADAYKHRCLVWLRRAWAFLPEDSRVALRPLLDAHGCTPWLAVDAAVSRVPVPDLAPF